MAKVKFTGRPGGSANKSTGQLRNEYCKIRCSAGFNEVRNLLAEQLGISTVDVLHNALQQYAYKQTITKGLKQWVDKI